MRTCPCCDRPDWRSPGSRIRSLRTCQGLRPRRISIALAISRFAVLPSATITASAPGICVLSWLNGWPIRTPVNYKGFPIERKSSTVFLSQYAALPTSCEKVKDCVTTTGHFEPMARTLMKDARKDLIRFPGFKFPVDRSGTPRAGPTRFTSPLAVQSDRFYSFMMFFIFGSCPVNYCPKGNHAAVGSSLKSSPYFRMAQAILAFLAAIAIAALQ